MLTEQDKKAIRDMYFADCPITVLDNPSQEVKDYYYSFMHEQDLPPFEPCPCTDDDDELPW